MKFSAAFRRPTTMLRPWFAATLVLLSGLTAEIAHAQSEGDRLSESVVRQIQALDAEKEGRTPAQRKIDSQLLYALKMDRGEAIAPGVATLEVNVGADRAGQVIVDISADLNDGLLATLSSMGVKTSSVFPKYHTFRASARLDQLETIAGLPGVRFIQPQQRSTTHSASQPGQSAELTPVSETVRLARIREALRQKGLGGGQTKALPNGYDSRGAENAEAVTSHGVWSARGTFNTDGTGIRIGVLSNGVTSMAASQASGDLPPTCSSLTPPATEHCINVVPGQAGTGDEGTAMLEVIHDIAPGAQLYYATGSSTIGQFATNILTLRNTYNCDIIVDDVGYFVESAFQDGQSPAVISPTNGGIVTQAVNDVAAAGALYFSSAANSGNANDLTSGTWEGDFADAGTLALVPGGRVHDFDPTAAVATSNLLTVGTGTAPMSLSWSDPLGGSSNDYDLYVLNSTLTTIINSSTNVQTGTQDPYEQTSATVAANRRVVILQKTGAANRFLHLDTNRGALSIATSGSTHGHNAASGAYGVAASPVFMPNLFPAAGPVYFNGPYPNLYTTASKVEPFSSDGPRRIFFSGNGTALTPGNFSATGGSVLQQPLITAADGNSITGAGGFSNPFYGTSCAAPVAAAIAGLIKAVNPALTPAQIKTALTTTALDIEAAGVDRDAGNGIVMPYPAMQSLALTGKAFLEYNGQVATVAPDLNGNNLLDPGENASLSVNLRNSGLLSATSITTTLTTTNPNVVITQATSAYSNLAAAASGNDTTLYGFTLLGSAAQDAVIKFTLTVNYTGGWNASQVINFTVQTGRQLIATTLDATAPPTSASFPVTASGNQTGRLNLSGTGTQSTCAAAKTNPGASATGARAFDSYTLTNTSASTVCVTVTLQEDKLENDFLFAVAYAGSYNPAAPATNYLADWGTSNRILPMTMSFNVLAGQTIVIVVVGNTAALTGTPYTLLVSGLPSAVPIADLAITKTDGVSTVTAGGSTTYTVTASNVAGVAAVGATVADTFPAGLTCSWTCAGAGSGTCTASGSGNINDSVNLPIGGSVTYTANCAISVGASGTLSNTATVTGPGGFTDVVPGNNSATDSDTVVANADLAITKTDGVTTATAGGSVTYTITASNAGPSNATGATVADTFPASETCSWICVGAGGGSCTASGSGNINNTVNLPSGGSVTYTASCAISAAATGTLSNTATVTAPASVTDPTPGNNSATDSDTLAASADLAITKTDGVTTATAGGSVTYTITASNAGPSNATGATVADTFPAAETCTWTCVGASGGTCTASGSGNINNTVNLPSGGSVTYTASCAISAAATGTLSNTATVTAPASVTDPTPGNNSATDSDTLAASADLAITKTDGVTTATAGGSVTYTITASNAGPSNATGATVADTFPASETCTWICVGASGGTCTASGSGNINNTVNLPGGGSVTYTASCAISAAATGTLSNTATVTAPAGVTDPTPGNNSATDSDTLGASADLAITKTDGVTTATAGGSVTYTITASNAGPSNATGATVADTFPAAETCTWTCVGASGGTCTASGSGNINNTVNLPSGGSVTYTASCAISAAATGTLSNTATVTAPAGVTDPTPGNNSATDSDTLVASADLAITKTDGVTTAAPGGSVSYQIVASNAGPSNAPGSIVTDPFPAALTCSWTCAGSAGGTCTASGSGNINGTVNLPSGGSVTYTAACTISASASGSLVNTASVATAAGISDPTPGNNSATDTDTLVAQANLGIVKTNGLNAVVVGSALSYTLTASNAGPSNILGATVTDSFPATLEGCTWTCVGSAGGSCTASGSGNLNSTANLPVAATVVYTANCTLSGTASGTLSNTASITAPAGSTDPVPGNNSSTDADPIVPVALFANGFEDSARLALLWIEGSKSSTLHESGPLLLPVGNDGNGLLTGYAIASPLLRLVSADGGLIAEIQGRHASATLDVRLLVVDSDGENRLSDWIAAPRESLLWTLQMQGASKAGLADGKLVLSLDRDHSLTIDGLMPMPPISSALLFGAGSARTVPLDSR